MMPVEYMPQRAVGERSYDLDEAVPQMPHGTAKVVLANLGRGGFCHVRRPYRCQFYGAATELGIVVSSQEVFHNGVWMLRFTRIR